MSDAWEDTENKAKAAGDGKFVKLKDDEDKVIGMFVGEPLPRDLYYNGATKKFEEYTDEHKKAGKKSQLKITLNMVVKAEGNGLNVKELPVLTLKAIEVTPKTYKSIMKFRKKHGFRKVWCEVERSGVAGDTDTTYTVLPVIDDDMEMTDADRTFLDEVEPMDLRNLRNGDEEDEDFDSYDKEKGKGKAKASKEKEKVSDEPISKAEAGEIVPALRELPREKLGEFLTKFGVARIKDLKKSDFASAKALVESWSKPEEKEEEEDETDPFA